MSRSRGKQCPLAMTRESEFVIRYAVVMLFFVLALAGVWYLAPLRAWPWTSRITEPADQEEDVDIVTGKCPRYSPSYPSAGGPGCRPECTVRDGRTNSSYGAGFYNSTHSWPKDLIHNMHLAATILKKYGSPNSLDTEKSSYLHVTFDYYCCYTPEEAAKINEFLNSYTWEPRKVWFDQMVCVIYGTGDMVAIVLMLDENSQKDLLTWALDTERDLEVKSGVRKHIPHTHLQDFHMTLATVNQSVFPVQPAVKEINRIIPPGSWHSAPIILHNPVCNKCGKAATTV